MAFELSPPGPQRRDMRYCMTHKGWVHYSRFCRRWRPDRGIWHWDEECKACQQIKRNEKKNQDRARALVERRAISRARILEVPKQKLLQDMHYLDLVADVRAKMTDEGKCVDCGEGFIDGDADIQFEHREPPRDDRWPDWAREHARNITLACGSCNRTKGNKPYSDYLDEAEETRMINEQHQRGRGKLF